MAMSQTLSDELEGTGVRVQVVCPGVVATEFHTVQGVDLSAVPRTTAEDAVNGSLRGLELHVGAHVVWPCGLASSEDYWPDQQLEFVASPAERACATHFRRTAKVWLGW